MQNMPSPSAMLRHPGGRAPGTPTDAVGLLTWASTRCRTCRAPALCSAIPGGDPPEPLRTRSGCSLGHPLDAEHAEPQRYAPPSRGATPRNPNGRGRAAHLGIHSMQNMPSPSAMLRHPGGRPPGTPTDAVGLLTWASTRCRTCRAPALCSAIPGGDPPEPLRTRSGCSLGHPLDVEHAEPQRYKQPADQPEPDDDGGLGPADELEMVLEGRHAEHPPAGQLERADLDDDRQRNDHEQAAQNRQEQLGPGADGEAGEDAAERERSGVTHEDLGRRCVPPQEPEAGAEHRRRYDREIER